MTNLNINQSRNQTADFDVMVSSCSFDCQHWGLGRHHARVSFSFTGTITMNELTTQIKYYSTENGQGTITNLHYRVILGATLHKECIEKI